jgi:hemerythrin-like domain-containing protein
MKNITRRGFILGVGSGVTGLISLGSAGELVAKTKAKQAKEPEVSPAEDLMREHGVLRRILLIYREWQKRLALNTDDLIGTLAESNQIVRSFVENYHEKLEEDYLFPRFRKAGKMVELVDVLLEQHRVGRALTETSLQLSNPESIKVPANRIKLASSLGDFICMYEPHAAREDTILFPSFHEMMPEKQYDRLGDMFEKKENELFGAKGFEKTVDRVASIEKRLGIYDLKGFTPAV